MRRWQSHKIVEADDITDIVNTMATKAVVTEGASAMEAERHEVPDNFFARGTPQIGDYLVRYEDGYLSWSPKAAFESGYTLIDKPRPTIEELEKILAEPSSDVEILPDGSVRTRVDPDDMKFKMGDWRVVGEVTPTTVAEAHMRNKLVRFLVARIAKFESGYDSTDAARMEELSWLLLQAVGGQIL